MLCTSKSNSRELKIQVPYEASENNLQNRWKTDFWPNFVPIQGQKGPKYMALEPIFYILLKVILMSLKNKFYVNPVETLFN